jgi:competence protein ComGF
MPKRVDQHIRSRLKGFTLIEVVVSLILLAAVMLLWRPVLLHVTRFTLQDHVLITSLQAEHDLQMFVRDKKLRSVALMSVRVRSPEKAYTINFYQSQTFSRYGSCDGI